MKDVSGRTLKGPREGGALSGLRWAVSGGGIYCRVAPLFAFQGNQTHTSKDPPSTSKAAWRGQPT